MPDVDEVIAESIAAPKLTHKGHGKYVVEGSEELFNSKAEAEAFAARVVSEAEFANEHGDVVPEGVEIHDRTLIFNGSILEVPMNMMYLPDGDFNPMYDRAWFYGWGTTLGTDVADKRAKGYKPVTPEELQAAVDAGKAPEHYLSLLHQDGNMLVYGDAVLMRMPRVLWRQRLAEKQEAAMRRIKRTEEEQEAAKDRLGMRDPGVPLKNELTIRL